MEQQRAGISSVARGCTIESQKKPYTGTRSDALIKNNVLGQSLLQPERRALAFKYDKFLSNAPGEKLSRFEVG